MEYERFDGCFGEVASTCAAGAYLTLDNGQRAFAFNFHLPNGTKTLCTVLKMATADKLMLVSIDSVIWKAHEIA